MKTELPAEVLEQMNREGWATIEEQKQYWIDKEAQSNNATSETREALIAALKPFALAFTESSPVRSIPDEKVWIWKPSNTKRETYGISRAHLKTAACLVAQLSTTADPKPKDDNLSRTEATTDYLDHLDCDMHDCWEEWSLRDEGRNDDGTGESYSERNV